MEPPTFSNFQQVAILCILLLLLLLLLLKKLKTPKTSNSTMIKLPPGPWKLPFIGSMHHLIGEQPHRRLHSLANKYGPLLHLKLGEINLIVISSPELAREALKTHDIYFASRPETMASKIIFYDGKDFVFTSYGKYWSQMRKICTAELLSAKRVESFCYIREEEGEKLVEKIRMARGILPVNLKEMFLSLSIASFSRAAFGKECAHQKKFVNAMKESFKQFSGFDFVDLYPSLSFIGELTGFRARLERLHRNLDEILEEILEEHRAKKVEGDGIREDIVDVLFGLMKNQGDSSDFCLTTDNIKAVILALFFAASETQSSTMEWVMSALIQHPDIMQRVQLEVRKTFKGKIKMEERDINKFPYLTQVIKETLRLYPPGPLLLPRLCRETIEIEGYTIPAGSQIAINAWTIMREPRCWVDSESFRPERFEEASFDFKGSKVEYIPFGGGRRICPGITYAIAGLEYWLAQLLFHFDWKLPGDMRPEELDMTETFGLAINKKIDLLLIATPHK